jgi:hypothetical protein
MASRFRICPGLSPQPAPWTTLFQAAKVLAFAAEDWEQVTGTPFPEPRSLDALHRDAQFAEAAREAVVAAVPFAAHEAA